MVKTGESIIYNEIFKHRVIDLECEKYECVAKCENKIMLETKSNISFPALFYNSIRYSTHFHYFRNKKTLIYCHSSTVCLDKTMLHIAESYYYNLHVYSIIIN